MAATATAKVERDFSFERMVAGTFAVYEELGIPA
jgi:hypothetical protein